MAKKFLCLLMAALAASCPMTSRAESIDGGAPEQMMTPDLARGVGNIVVETLGDAGAAGLDFKDDEGLRAMAEFGEKLPEILAASPEMAGALHDALRADKNFDLAKFKTLPVAQRLQILKTAAGLARQNQEAKAGNGGPAAAKPLALGIDISAMDPSVRPQDDLFHFVNGTWIKNFKMPADKSIYRIFDKLNDQNEKAINDLIQGFAAESAGGDANKQKIADFHKSYLDTEAVEARGLDPIAADLEKIEKVQDKAELPGLFAWAQAQSISVPIGLSVSPDRKNPAAYITYLVQAGLGMPSRRYYLKQDERSAELRAKYIEYTARLLALAGEADAEKKARAVFELEKSLARHQWTAARNRDAVKTYNKVPIPKLGALAKGFDWTSHLSQAGIRPEETDVVVKQPSYLTGFAMELSRQTLETWKLYLKVRLLAASASYLSDAFVQAKFDFSGRALSGRDQLEPRWKRGVQLVNDMVGGLVGPFYAQKFFPESSKRRMEALVENERTACAALINGAAWMSAETKRQALEKLGKMIVKIGYPDRWRDYSQLVVKTDDLIGNVRRAAKIDYDRLIAKLGRPVDRLEWTQMNPQTLNAEFNPVLNAMTFPAAIIQAPMFDPTADDAANYGSIGAVIGHEMSHGFDDQGSRSDGDGLLRDWWMKKDREAFEARAQQLLQQFNSYEPLPGQHINGKNTLGENIADLAGLTIALHAYRLSLGGSPAPIINGYTGEQRVFLGFAQTWRGSVRDEELSRRLVIDPHSPEQYRVNGIPRNMPEFYGAFDVKKGDALYLPEAQRVSIW
jgi:predicted metalloendopeptidase